MVDVSQLIDFHISNSNRICRLLIRNDGRTRVKDVWRRQLSKALGLKPHDHMTFDIMVDDTKAPTGIPQVRVSLSNYTILHAYYEHDGPGNSFEVRETAY